MEIYKRRIYILYARYLDIAMNGVSGMEFKMKFKEVGILFELSYDTVQKHAVKIRELFPGYADDNALNSEDFLYYSAFVFAYKEEKVKNKKVSAGLNAYIDEVKKTIAITHNIDVSNFTLFGR